MRRLVLVLAAAALLAGCTTSSDPFVNAVQRYGLACDTYSSTLNVLTPLRVAGRLDQSTIDAVDKVVALASPICEADTPPVGNLDLLLKLENGITNLIALRQKVANEQ